MDSLTAPVRVLHAFGRMTRAGAELRTLDVMRACDRNRFRLEFIALTGQAGELDAEIQTLGGTVHPLSIREGGFLRKFTDLLVARKIDVVHSHVHMASGYLLRAATAAGIQGRVCHFRASGDLKPGGWWRRLQQGLLGHWVQQHATNILGVSQAALHGSWGSRWQSDPRCEVIYNGVDQRPFLNERDPEVKAEFGWDYEDRICLHVGNLTAPKNHQRLLTIFNTLRQRDPRFKLLCAGAGDAAAVAGLESQIAELRLQGQVVLAGSRQDIPRLQRVADLMVFPSISEGLPGAVLEAAAAGTPTLATDLPTLAEIQTFLPGLRTLSLSESDDTWAGLGLLMAERFKGDTSRAELARSFERSPFSVEQCARAHEALWLRAAHKVKTRAA